MEAHGIPENFSDPGFRVDWLRVILKILSQKSSGLDGHIYFYHLLPNMIQVTSVDSLYIYIRIYIYIFISTTHLDWNKNHTSSFIYASTEPDRSPMAGALGRAPNRSVFNW